MNYVQYDKLYNYCYEKNGEQSKRKIVNYATRTKNGLFGARIVKKLKTT